MVPMRCIQINPKTPNSPTHKNRRSGCDYFNGQDLDGMVEQAARRLIQSRLTPRHTTRPSRKNSVDKYPMSTKVTPLIRLDGSAAVSLSESLRAGISSAAKKVAKCLQLAVVVPRVQSGDCPALVEALREAHLESVHRVSYVLQLLVDEPGGVDAFRVCKLVTVGGLARPDQLGNSFVAEDNGSWLGGQHFQIDGSIIAAWIIGLLTLENHEKLLPLPMKGTYLALGSTLTLQALPQMENLCSWLPVDQLTKCTVEIAESCLTMAETDVSDGDYNSILPGIFSSHGNLGNGNFRYAAILPKFSVWRSHSSTVLSTMGRTRTLLDYAQESGGEDRDGQPREAIILQPQKWDAPPVWLKEAPLVKLQGTLPDCPGEGLCDQCLPITDPNLDPFHTASESAAEPELSNNQSTSEISTEANFDLQQHSRFIFDRSMGKFTIYQRMQNPMFCGLTTFGQLL
ncbi:hypothetical protein FE257_005552 [Aspergillus nanangensis]|uniref:Uncharacterized protein n=1 Tax=Aspergillus nanangensis TaxID=2582783 RepID=A0AAD4CQ95_ASPNN|nr:hypothetical protein FE257_005552 [Aspergillus nanangensis]